MILERVVLPDGRVLNNFVPKNLSGVWTQQEPAATFSTSAPPAMTSWAEARFRANRPTVGAAAALVFTRRADWEILEHHCMPPDGAYAQYKDRAWEPR